MKATVRVLNILIRISGAGALVLGLAFWLGYARSWTQLHMGLGIGLVVMLWALAGIAWRKSARTGVATFGAVLGLGTWILGVTQSQILLGPLHWVIEIAHLMLAVMAIGVGGRLASALVRRTETG